ncbi:hypothetical protein PO909_029557 [Leuciscus waleckii]
MSLYEERDEEKDVVHYQNQRAASPEPSLMSMKSDESMGAPHNLSDESMGAPYNLSDESMGAPHNLSDESMGAPHNLSDESMGAPHNFSDETVTFNPRQG